MIVRYESKGQQFDIQGYTVDRVTRQIAALMKVDEVIAGYPNASDEKIKSFSASQTEDRWTLKNFTYPLPEKERLSFIVLHDEAAIAYMIASTYADGKKSHLSRIAVAEEFQSYGIGRKLIELLESQSRKLGVNEITLSTMYKGDDDKVVQWYERLGYSIMKTEDEVREFLASKNKTQDFDLFWPWNQNGKLLNMHKKL